MSKEHAYAYESGYRDGSINYELEHCPACKNVADLQEALAENAKLRERYYAYEYKMDSLVSSLTGGLLSKSAATPNDVLYSSVVEELTEDQIKENCKLEAENAKLRELAHDLLQPILAEGFDCYGCVHEDCDGMQYTDRCKLLDRARELGIEVE